MMSIGSLATGATSKSCEASDSPKRNKGKSLAHEEELQLMENLVEVHHIARRIHARLPRHILFDDLVHEGVVGLIDAVKKYNPSKSPDLRSYARHRIRGAILDSLRELDWGSRQLRRQSRRIEQATGELTGRLGRFPSEAEIASELRVPLSEFQRVLNELHCLRADGPAVSPELFSREQVLGVRSVFGAEDPFEACFRIETAKVLMDAIEMLSEKERQALILYYFEERTMKEIGRVLGVHESRISQIITTAESRLRLHLEKSLKK